MNSSKMAQEVSAVVGGEELIAKQSAVDERGDLRKHPH
jgi:hypothetical protein